jgi:hypothetical protein
VRFHALSPLRLDGDAHDGHATCGSVAHASRFLIGLVTCSPRTHGTPQGAGWIKT